MRYAATIVVYKPDKDRLNLSVNAIIAQVDVVIIVYNGTEEEYKNTITNDSDKIIHIYNNSNKGIAYAINRAVEYCINRKIQWLITLDQDSIVPSNIISEYNKYTYDKDIGIICCRINYNGIHQDQSFDGIKCVERAITSASMIDTYICRNLGGMDENMFIDNVDYEYSYRIRNNGYKIIMVGTILLDHQLGELNSRRFLYKKINVENHSETRVFYIVRNYIYCTKKHSHYCSKKDCIRNIIVLTLKVILYENNKLKKLRSIFKGIKDGLSMKVDQVNYINIEKEEQYYG